MSQRFINHFQLSIMRVICREGFPHTSHKSMHFLRHQLYSHVFSSRPSHFTMCTGFQVELRTLIKNKIKFSSYMRKFRMEQLQSHIWGNIFAFPHILGRPSSYMTQQLLHSLNFLIYKEHLIFFFISVQYAPNCLNNWWLKL